MMKNIHTILLSFAASLLLVPVASAQTDHEKYTLDNGVGGNKYVVNTYPNDDGEYTLRLEAFITGGVSASAVPTDFVLVLDASGSMFYDYRPASASTPMNDTGSSWATLWPYFMHEPGNEYTAFSIYYTYKNGSVGSAGSGSPRSTTNHVATRSYYSHFTDEAATTNCSLYYHYVDPANPGNDGYYKIFRRMFDAADDCLLAGPADPSAASTWKKYAGQAHTGTPTTLSARPETVLYNLAIKLKDGTYKYLNGNGLSDSRYDATTTNRIMFINDGNIYRLKRRAEALTDGVEGFVNLIAAENAKDQWASNIPAKHQVAIVRFSGDYASGHVEDITPLTSYSVASQVLTAFTEVNDADAFNADFEDRYIISGSTYTDYGMRLARLLLQDLETKDGGKYAALNQSGGTNRNKVVVFFTDGEPSSHSGGSWMGTVTPTIRDGKVVKQVGVGNINGKIYSIDLAMTASAKTFLEHLSSNYPYGDTNKESGAYAVGNFTGDIVPIEGDEYFENDEPIYYKDSNDGDLTSVFSGIASSNTGQQSGSKLVVMDVMSESFKLPSNLSGKVKFYTAQCIGTKEIDGETYLAFAQEVEANARPALEHLWVSHVEGEGEAAVTVWEDLGASGGIDIDEGITYTPSSDGKSITVKGFDYVTYWCGKDDVIGHNNTRQIESTDPNYDYQVDGYRGFKLIIEFPIVVSENAIGGPLVLTNNEIQSGVYSAGDDGTATGNPIITYDSPSLLIPVRLDIRKSGLKPGESASFILQRRAADGTEWEDYTSFILIGTDGTNLPSVQMFTMDPSYYYRIKENGWSWNYTNPAQVETTYPSTETLTLNPIVIENTYADKDVKHAEAQAVNTMKSGSSGSTTVYDVN